jgi:glycosyltransferase involved in cell wall biosynthesis
MRRLYIKEKGRLDLLREYRAIVTHSAYLRNEYIKHGLNATRIFDLPYAISGEGECHTYSDIRKSRLANNPGAPIRLLFLGRMERLKGGELFLRAVPEVRSRLERPVSVQLVGDGPERFRWEHVAKAMRLDDSSVDITFRGWLQKTEMAPLWSDIDLIVVPSIWPEPFGLVGTEAALHGIPAAAFDIGGIRSWIEDGVNGRLAAADPPTPNGLAGAIVDCVGNPDVYGLLGRAAQSLSRRFEVRTHLRAFVEILSDCTGTTVTQM